MDTAVQIAHLLNPGRLDEVFNLYRGASAKLGHMPRGGFEEAIAKKTLIVASTQDLGMIGYVLYRVTNRTACIAHVCVKKEMRRMRVAEMLLNHLKQSTSHLDGIRLKCRDDYNVAPLWQRCGFIARGSTIGRGADAAALTVWHFSHNQADLFSEIVSAKPKAVIDANVFFDFIIPDRPGHAQAQALTNPWLEDMVDLAITPEIYNDINRGTDPKIKELSRAQASTFEELRASGIDVDRMAAGIRKLYPDGRVFWERDESDVRHIAFTIAAGAQYFVTRDQRLLGLAPEVLHHHSVQVLTPAELVSHLDMIQREGEYQPRRLGGTSVRTKKLDALDVGTAMDAFRHPQEGTRDFRSLLEAALANPQNGYCALTHDTSGQPAVLLCASPSSGSRIDLSLIRVAGSALGPTILRNRLMTLIQETAKRGHPAIKVSDPHVSPAVREALEELGFHCANGAWLKPLMDGFHDFSAITAQLAAHALPVPDLELPADIDSLSTFIWPGKLDSDRFTCYLVPIEACWAEHFFDTELASTRLPGLSGIREDLHLGVEGVYYSAAKMGLYAPGYILWYVSKGREGVGSMEVKALSRLREVAVGTPKELFRRFNRLGVYGWKDVLGKAKGNMDATLIALRFSHTELFPVPLPGSRLAEFGVPHPYGPRVVPYATFRQILNHAFPTPVP